MRSLLILALAACADPDADPSEETDPTTPETCELRTEIPCEDDLFLDLAMQEEGISEGAVTTEKRGDDWVTEIDARAGGVEAAPRSPWVYLRFDDDGAHKVEITDAASLTSGEWHLAAKRYLIRTNGGSSGPSCLTATALPGEDYADVTDVAGEFQGEPDASYTKSCEFVADNSGLEDSPKLALSDWWTYPGCVATTGTPFILALEDGRRLKLVVQRYYAEGQETCNTTGSMGTGSAELSIRWAFLP